MSASTVKATADAPQPEAAQVLDYQVAEGLLAPSFDEVLRCAREAMDATHWELSVRVVDEGEGRMLNQRWRQRDYATNVLSFPCDSLVDLPVPLLGDVVLCAPVVLREAEEQGKPAAAHWAHLLVHGILHLRGYDHEQDTDALHMEQQEVAILARLGYPDPYIPR